MVRVDGCARRAHVVAERAHERHGQRFEDRDLEPTLARGGRDLGADEARADDHDDAARRLVELGAQTDSESSSVRST